MAASRRQIEVFAAGTDWVQVVWRGTSDTVTRLELGSATAELDAHVALGAVTLHDLKPGTEEVLHADGRALRPVRTLERPEGRLLARVATISDLHLGEWWTGSFPRLTSVRSSRQWRDAHPVVCLRAAVAEIADWAPDVVVVKGDVSHSSRLAEYELAMNELSRLGVPLIAIAGNHDDGHPFGGIVPPPGGSTVHVADPIVTHDLPGGARLVAADTRIARRHAGTLDGVGEAVCAAAARTGDAPALVFLHHQLMDTSFPRYLPLGIPQREAEPFCDALAAVAPRAWVTSGHTHRNRARRRAGLTITEVGSPKDYPGVWAAYELYENGIVQSVRRVEAPEALSWNERTRATAARIWGVWSPGSFDDRCLVSRW